MRHSIVFFCMTLLSALAFLAGAALSYALLASLAGANGWLAILSNAAEALIVGLCVGIVLAFVNHRLNKEIHEREDSRRSVGAYCDQLRKSAFDFWQKRHSCAKEREAALSLFLSDYNYLEEYSIAQGKHAVIEAQLEIILKLSQDSQEDKDAYIKAIRALVKIRHILVS